MVMRAQLSAPQRLPATIASGPTLTAQGRLKDGRLDKAFVGSVPKGGRHRGTGIPGPAMVLASRRARPRPAARRAVATT